MSEKPLGIDMTSLSTFHKMAYESLSSQNLPLHKYSNKDEIDNKQPTLNSLSSRSGSKICPVSLI